jgi:hypothetical protein
MTPSESVTQAFAELRAHCDPRGHELLLSLEELCVEAVEHSRTIAAYVATLEHERKVERLLDEWQQRQTVRVEHRPHLRSVER